MMNRFLFLLATFLGSTSWGAGGFYCLSKSSGDALGVDGARAVFERCAFVPPGSGDPVDRSLLQCRVWARSVDVGRKFKVQHFSRWSSCERNRQEAQMRLEQSMDFEKVLESSSYYLPDSLVYLRRNFR